MKRITAADCVLALKLHKLSINAAALAAAMAGSTTMGNQRVEFGAVIKKVEAAL